MNLSLAAEGITVPGQGLVPPNKIFCDTPPYVNSVFKADVIMALNPSQMKMEIVFICKSAYRAVALFFK